MKLTENWSIEPGPHKQDYQLHYEDNHYDEKKEKWVKSSQNYFYPTFESAVNGFVRHTGIELVGEESPQQVIDKMEELKQTILSINEKEHVDDT